MSQYVGSKWSKTLVLLKDKQLRKIVPMTIRLNEENLIAMLNEFDMVYVKPDRGTFGIGVIRVERHKEQYQFQIGEILRKFKTYNAMYNSLNKLTGSKAYLVQRGIHLLKHERQRFDLRVMVQLSPDKEWETTGIIGRVAAPKKVVTNYHNGGTPIAIEPLLAPYLTPKQVSKQIEALKKMGVLTAKAMKRRFPGVSEIGLDIGLDGQYKPWVLEINTRPDPYIFNNLADKSIYKKVMRYARANGRVN